MTEKTKQVPEWIKEIWNHLSEKPYKYKNLIENSFGITALEELEDSTKEGYGFGLGFLFYGELLCAEQLEFDLRIY